MNILPLFLAGFLSIGLPQENPPAAALVDLAGSGSRELLVAEVRLHPDAAREGVHDLFLHSVEGGVGSSSSVRSIDREDALETAERLARAYFDAWTDPFLIQEVERFKSWSLNNRRTKLLADSLRLAGNVAYQAEGVPLAMGLWRESLEHSQSMEDPSGRAKSLGNLGAGFYVAGEPDSAKVYLRAAYQRATELGDFRTAASAITNLANLAFDHGRLPEAAELYTQAVVILSRTGEHRTLSAVQHNLGLVSMDLGDGVGARDALEQSIQLSRLHGYPEDEAEALASLADVAQAEGEYQDAVEHLDRALRLSRETGSRVAEAGVQHSMGLLNLARGDYRVAERQLEEALAAYTELGRLPDAIDVRQDLARARVATGALRSGAQDLDWAARLADSLSLGSPVKAELALAQADLYLALNDYPRASDLFKEAEQIFSQTNSVSGQANALEGQGLLFLIRGDHEEAQGIFSKTLLLRDRSALPDPRASSVTRLYLAAAQEETGDVSGARETLLTAGDALASVGDVVGQAAVMAALGGLELGGETAASADSFFVQGLELLGERSAPEMEWRLHAGRARVLEKSGRLWDAAGELRLAIGAVERGGVNLPIEERERYRAENQDLYERLAGVLVHLGELEDAFEMSERARAQRALAVLNGGRIGIPPGAPLELVAREQDLRRRLSELSLAMRGSNQRFAGLREGNLGMSLGPSDLQAASVKAQKDYARLLADMRMAAPDYSSLVNPTLTSLEEVSSHLRVDQALLEYLAADDNVVVFVVTSDTVAVVPLDIAEEALSDLVTFARGVVEGEGRGNLGELWRSSLQALHGALIDPIEDTGILSDRESLVIVPHGDLHYLPFQALVRPPEGTFLIERYAVSYAPSASAWIQLQDRASVAFRREESISDAGTREKPRVLAMAPRIGELPGSGYETEMVGRLFGDRARVLLGGDATERAFRELAPGVDIIHLATYGRLNKANPLFSYVEMAGSLGESGLLEIHEIFGLRLEASLLTLSACETALGSGGLWDVPPGDDWVSLASAFLGVGAANVLASVWRVEDLATAGLMRRFYGHLFAGVSLEESLARAQRELIANPDTAHPFFWAGFLLVGGGGGIL